MKTQKIIEALNTINEDTYLISDLHFGHNHILTFEKCREVQMLKDGFNNHEEWLIHNWNSVVKENDTVLCLGDFAFKGFVEYSKRLNGNKIIVLGNHDKKPTAQAYQDGNWTVIDGFYNSSDTKMTSKLLVGDELFSGFTKVINNVKFMFSHYPVFHKDEYDRKNKLIKPRIELLETIYLEEKCNLQIHGHLHSSISSFEDAVNVSLEHTDFKPKKLKTIMWELIVD